MSTTPRPASGSRPPGWQQEHARRYVESGGRDVQVYAARVVPVRWININELDCEISVRAVLSGPKLHHQPPRHFDVSV